MTKSPSAWDIYVRILSYFNNCSSHGIFSILLMEQILHQLIGSLSNYLRFMHPRWCRISSINRINWLAVFTHQLGETHHQLLLVFEEKPPLQRNNDTPEKQNWPEKSMDSKPPTACVFSLAVSKNPRNPIRWSPDFLMLTSWAWSQSMSPQICEL